MSDMSKDDVLEVANWLYSRTAWSIEKSLGDFWRRKRDGATDRVEVLEPFWSSLDAWQEHVWPRLRDDSGGIRIPFWKKMQRLSELEMMHTDAATRTKALAAVLRKERE